MDRELEKKFHREYKAIFALKQNSVIAEVKLYKKHGELTSEEINKLNVQVFIIDEMNEFCSNWDGLIEVEHIPMMMKLFDDDCYTCEQNEFVMAVIYSAYKKNPQVAMQTIVKHISILFEYNGEAICGDFLSLFLFDDKQHYLAFVGFIADTDISIAKIWINEIEDQIKSNQKRVSNYVATNQKLLREVEKIEHEKSKKLMEAAELEEKMLVEKSQGLYFTADLKQKKLI